MDSIARRPRPVKSLRQIIQSEAKTRGEHRISETGWRRREYEPVDPFELLPLDIARELVTAGDR